MSYNLEHLHRAWDVDRKIILEEEKLVVIRFGKEYDPVCVKMDKMLSKIEYDVSNFATISLVDIEEVPDFNALYELYDPCTVMFFYRNKHMRIDLGTGDNNKLNFLLKDSQELIDIIETIYRGARKGKGLVVSNIDYSVKTKY